MKFYGPFCRMHNSHVTAINLFSVEKFSILSCKNRYTLEELIFLPGSIYLVHTKIFFAGTPII